MKTFFLILFLSFSLFSVAHEGHEERNAPTSATLESVQDKVKKDAQEGRPTSWTQWVGSLHLIFLHFPITLINMLAASEILLARTKKSIFEFVSRFLVISAAILSSPTALLGLIYSYSASYEGLMATFLWWHMWLGISTAIVTLVMVFIRERIGVNKFYYSCLFLLFLLVNFTSFFGGRMTFGPYHMYPPL